MSDPTVDPTGSVNINDDNRGWRSWGIHVLEEMKRLNQAQDKIEKEIIKIHIEVATLKVKSTVWGAVGGAIPVVIGLVYLLLQHYGNN